MAEEMLSYRHRDMHDAAMNIVSIPLRMLQPSAGRGSHAHNGVNFVKFGHLDTAR
jgi:hypothetical protein